MNPVISSMPSSSALQQQCTFCLEEVSSQFQFGGRSLVTTDCTVHSQAHLDCIYENLKSDETDSLSKRDCRCGPKISLFRNEKPLLEDAFQKGDLEAFEMGLALNPVGNCASAVSDATRMGCYTECFQTMWSATHHKIMEERSQEVKENLEKHLQEHLKKLQYYEEKTNDLKKDMGDKRPPDLDDTLRKVENNIKALENWQDKLKRVGFLLSILGTMKAGKSTTINAIVGMDVLPKRGGSGMTAIPTLVRHSPGNQVPVLSLSPKIINTIGELLPTLHKYMTTGKGKVAIEKLENENYEMKEVLNKIKSKSFTIKKEYKGENNVLEGLSEINYVVRILEKFDIAFNIEDFFQLESIPVIKVEFTSLRDLGGADKYPLSLMDTPGTDEFKGQEKSGQLTDLVKNLLNQSNATLAVLEYNHAENEASKNIYKCLEDLDQTDNIFVWVNQFDRKGPEDSGEQETKHKVANKVDKLKACNVFPVSSQDARLAGRVRRELNLNNGCLIKSSSANWFKEFCERVFYLEDHEECSKKEYEHRNRNRVDVLWNKSMYEKVINACIRLPYVNAQLSVLTSTQMELTKSILELKNIEEQISKWGEDKIFIDSYETWYRKVAILSTTGLLMTITGPAAAVYGSAVGVASIAAVKAQRYLSDVSMRYLPDVRRYLPDVRRYIPDRFRSQLRYNDAERNATDEKALDVVVGQIAVVGAMQYSGISSLHPVGVFGFGLQLLTQYYASKFGANRGYSKCYHDSVAQKGSSETNITQDFEHCEELDKFLEEYKEPETDQKKSLKMSEADRNNLIKAVTNSNIKDLRSLIKKGINVNISFEKGNTPLHIATKNSSYECVKALIGERECLTEEIKKIIKQTINFFEIIQTGFKNGKFSALMGFINKVGDFYNFYYYITHRGADINTANIKGDTPLHIAADKDCVDCLDALVNAGANVNARNKFGNTPLHIAAQHGKTDFLNILLRNKYDVTKTLQAVYAEFDVIRDAMKKNDESKIDFALKILQMATTILPAITDLVGFRVNIDARTKKDETPLHIAAKYGNVKCVELLIENGADLSAKMDDGDTPLKLAEMNSDPNCKQIVQILKEELCKQKGRNTPAYSFAT